MKRALLALAVCLPLAGCFGDDQAGPDPAAPPDATTVWMAVRAFTLAACHFDPDLQTIAQLIAAGTGVNTNVLGSMVCSAVTGPVSRNKAGAVLAPTITVRSPGGKTARVVVRGQRA